MPLAKTTKRGLREQWPEKMLCIQHLASAPEQCVLCSSMPQAHFSQRRRGSAAHIYSLTLWLPKENLMGSACLWIWTQLIFWWNLEENKKRLLPFVKRDGCAIRQILIWTSTQLDLWEVSSTKHNCDSRARTEFLRENIALNLSC